MRRSTAQQRSYRPFEDVAARNSLQESFEIPALVKLLRVRPGQRILEVGCGRGVGLVALNRICRPSRLTGLDISEELLEHARMRVGPAIDLHLGDVRALPFADGSFDVVIDFGTCYHIAEPERALREISRVLRPGGVFVHETPLSQFLAHPIRSGGRSLPWRDAPHLVRSRSALFWSSRAKHGARQLQER